MFTLPSESTYSDLLFSGSNFLGITGRYCGVVGFNTSPEDRMMFDPTPSCKSLKL